MKTKTMYAKCEIWVHKITSDVGPWYQKHNVQQSKHAFNQKLIFATSPTYELYLAPGP